MTASCSTGAKVELRYRSIYSRPNCLEIDVLALTVPVPYGPCSPESPSFRALKVKERTAASPCLLHKHASDARGTIPLIHSK